MSNSVWLNLKTRRQTGSAENCITSTKRFYWQFESEREWQEIWKFHISENLNAKGQQHLWLLANISLEQSVFPQAVLMLPDYCFLFFFISTTSITRSKHTHPRTNTLSTPSPLKCLSSPCSLVACRAQSLLLAGIAGQWSLSTQLDGWMEPCDAPAELWASLLSFTDRQVVPSGLYLSLLRSLTCFITPCRSSKIKDK